MSVQETVVTGYDELMSVFLSLCPLLLPDPQLDCDLLSLELNSELDWGGGLSSEWEWKGSLQTCCTWVEMPCYTRGQVVRENLLLFFCPTGASLSFPAIEKTMAMKPSNANTAQALASQELGQPEEKQGPAASPGAFQGLSCRGMQADLYTGFLSDTETGCQNQGLWPCDREGFRS